MPSRILIFIIWTLVVTAFVLSWLMGSWLIGLIVLALSRIAIPLPRLASLIFWSGLLLPTVWFGFLFAFTDHLPSAPSGLHSLWSGVTYLLCFGPIISLITAAVTDCARVGGSRDA
jgi:hypothetical protein